MRIELEQEEDGRWLTEIPDLPGVMAYGRSQKEALAKVKALALRVLADRLEHGEPIPELVDVFSVAATGVRGGDSQSCQGQNCDSLFHNSLVLGRASEATGRYKTVPLF
jgi:predicted RNase H-like HicB family nuclease